VGDVKRPEAKDSVGKVEAAKGIKSVEADLKKVSNAIEKIQDKLQKAIKPSTKSELDHQLVIAVAARDDLIDRADELTLAAEKKEEEATETEDAQRFGDLKAFHGAGLRSPLISSLFIPAVLSSA
jgi:predicted  nucleic acid-binding Zn-ribbon protein